MPLPQGERSIFSVSEDCDVALDERRAVGLVLEEDHPVDVSQLGLERMDDRIRGLELTLHLAAQRNQTRQRRGLDRERQRAQVDGRVEGAAVRHVDDHPPLGRLELDRLELDEGRDVPEADGPHPAALDVGDGVNPARGTVDNHLRLRLADGDATVLEGPGHERDRSVTAGRRIARVVKEDDAEVAATVDGLRDEAAVHVGVPAWLVDEQPPDTVLVRGGVASLCEDRVPG